MCFMNALKVFQNISRLFQRCFKVTRRMSIRRFYIVLEGGLEGFFVFVFQCLDFPSKVIKHCFNIASRCFDMLM